jgi:hypothetical protein
MEGYPCESGRFEEKEPPDVCASLTFSFEVDPKSETKTRPLLEVSRTEADPGMPGARISPRII